MTLQKKVTGINCEPWPTFWQQQNLTYFNIFEVCAFWQISKASCACPKSWPTGKKLQAPTRAHDLLFWPKKIWPTLIFLRFTPPNTFPKLPVHVLINDPLQKKLQASTRTHAPFFDNTNIWPTFIFPRFRVPNTFPKLPVHVLINDPPQKSYRHQLWTMTHFLTTTKFDLL